MTDKFGEETLNTSSWLIQPKVPEFELIKSVDKFVDDMHTQNDLWVEAIDDGQHIRNVEEEAIEWLTRNSLPSGAIPMSGANVRFDRNWISEHLPKLDEWFHYRPGVDMSVFRETCKLINRPVFDAVPEVSKRHRVKDCLDGAVQQYKFFVDNFFFVSE